MQSYIKNNFLGLFALFMGASVPALHAGQPVQPYITADLTSAYLWRGQKNAGISIQPVLGIKWNGLNFYVWGNEQLSPPADQRPIKHEIDFFLKYQLTPNWNIGLKDVYVNTRGKGFFSFGSVDHAANGLDVLLTYSNKWFEADWTTTVAGYDGTDHQGKRAFGSYLILSNRPVNWCHIDWTGSVGIVPYYCSRYSEDDSNGFHVNMVSAKASHTFDLNKAKTTNIGVYTELMVNPSGRKAYFRVGAKFTFDPTAKSK